MEAILASSNSTFRKSTQNQSSLKEPRRPVWNESCQSAVSAAKKKRKRVGTIGSIAHNENGLEESRSCKKNDQPSTQKNKLGPPSSAA
jgi:hypothetical protein